MSKNNGLRRADLPQLGWGPCPRSADPVTLPVDRCHQVAQIAPGRSLPASWSAGPLVDRCRPAGPLVRWSAGPLIDRCRPAGPLVRWSAGPLIDRCRPAGRVPRRTAHGLIRLSHGGRAAGALSYFILFEQRVSIKKPAPISARAISWFKF